MITSHTYKRYLNLNRERACDLFIYLNWLSQSVRSLLTINGIMNPPGGGGGRGPPMPGMGGGGGPPMPGIGGGGGPPIPPGIGGGGGGGGPPAVY